jgi:phosphatidylglycerol:prolipoprotein diacylglycerol transferase
LQPVLFTIGKISIFSWGLMLAIAAIVAMVGIGRLFDREGYERDMVLDLVMLCIIFGIIGARIAYVLTYEWTAFLADPLLPFRLQEGGIRGMAWYGGLVGGAIPFVLYVWRKNLSFWKIADMFAPYLALGYALVRIGCFLNGCCYGNVTDSACGVVFPAVDAYHRHPTQLYSSALNFLLFLGLLRFYPHRKFPGQIFILYVIGYCIYRFIVEFFRSNELYIGILSIGQVYTLGLLLIAILAYYWLKSRKRRISL